MSLTKEFEYDCEVRGAHKHVQVRKTTIVKDDGAEISGAPITATFCIAVLKQVILGVIQTSLVKTHQYRQCVTLCGRVT